MTHHRFIPVTLDIQIVDPSQPAPGQKGGDPDDSQEVIDDLIRAVKNLRPKNKQGKSYQVREVKQK